MAAPSAVSTAGKRFGLYVLNGASGFEFYARAIVRRVALNMWGQCDADIDIDWTPIVNTAGTTVRAELTDDDIANAFGPTVRCAIAILNDTWPSNPENLQFVAHGYIEQRTLSFAANGSSANWRHGLKLRDISHWAGAYYTAHINGRVMRSKDAWDDAAESAEGLDSDTPQSLYSDDDYKIVLALPCIFNAGGRPNRQRRPILRKTSPAYDEHGYVFDGDDMPTARHWTYLQALIHVAQNYVPQAAGVFVGFGNLFTDSRRGTTLAPWWSWDEEDVPYDPLRAFDSWLDLMVRRCDNLSVEGLNAFEAMRLICETAGVHFAVGHNHTTPPIEVWPWLWFGGPSDGNVLTLGLERGGSYFSGSTPRTAAEMFAANNCNQANLAIDYGSSVYSVRVVGDRQQVVTGAELKPLWAPHDMWDDVGDDREDLLAEAMSDDRFVSADDTDFSARFSPDGNLWLADDQNSIVGRLWGLDSAGEFVAAGMERTSGPYDDYSTPWEPPGLTIDQVRRRRRLYAIPCREDEPQLGIVVEISVDGGTTWAKAMDRIQARQDLSAIYIAVRDLLAFGAEAIRELGLPSTAQNYYDAYMGGLFRMRAFFAVDLDEVQEATSASLASPVAWLGARRLVMRSRSYGFVEVRDGDVAVPAYVESIARERNDYDSAHLAAQAIALVEGRGKWTGQPSIPWIESTAYALGDRISGIVRSATETIKFGGNVGRDGAYPIITGLTWLVAEQATQITLNDEPRRRGAKP